MKNNKHQIIKSFLILLLIYLQCGFAFQFLYCISGYKPIIKIIYQIGWDLAFYNDGILLPIGTLWPSFIIVPVLIWIFYRNKISLKGRIIVTAESLWGFLSYIIGTFQDNKAVLTALIFILFDVLFITELSLNKKRKNRRFA